MATKKQLAALARARAIRAAKTRRCRTTRKRTGAEVAENKFKTAIVKASESVWSALKTFSSYVSKTGIELVKSTSLAALNTFRKQSARLTYIKALLNELMAQIDDLESKPDKDKIDNLEKNADILIKLIDIEMKENPKLPKRFVREVKSVPEYIKKLRDSI